MPTRMCAAPILEWRRRALLDDAAIDVFYGASQALFAMSLSVSEGEVVTLMGRNGMGKTTTVHVICPI